MNRVIFERLAKRLLKCPFDERLFVSALELRLHLCEYHAQGICHRRRGPSRAAHANFEIPEKLLLCGHCFQFAVPDNSGALGRLHQHIRSEHPNPYGKVDLKIAVSIDSTLIEEFIENQNSEEICVCSLAECSRVFRDELSAAQHWAEEHCTAPSVEETQRAFEADPDRFRRPLAECLSEVAEEEIRRRLSAPAPDDGYTIRHSPDVPRVRSKPGEHIIYVEREPVHFLDRELEELLECEGLDLTEDLPVGEVWSRDNQQTVHIDLRFCNILDGYIPLVKVVCRILPPKDDGEMIEVTWQGESIPCKVSRSKHAIYNFDGQLKRIFSVLPSGVRLYITRVGPRKYHLDVKRAPHVVRDCKFFVADGRGGWTVDIRDELIEWETGDHIFRHQLTFEQMEALRHEARRTNLSVRDSVYEAMKLLATNSPTHVLDVHDFVFLRLRTCSLAAVWAQFRPEHQCYVRVRPGWYRFSPSVPLPIGRFLPPSRRPRDRLTQYSNSGRRYRVKQRHGGTASTKADWSIFRAIPIQSSKCVVPLG